MCEMQMTAPSTMWSLQTHRSWSAIEFSCESTPTAAYCTLGFTRLGTSLRSQASGSSPAFEALLGTTGLARHASNSRVLQQTRKTSKARSDRCWRKCTARICRSARRWTAMVAVRSQSTWPPLYRAAERMSRRQPPSGGSTFAKLRSKRVGFESATTLNRSADEKVARMDWHRLGCDCSSVFCGYLPPVFTVAKRGQESRTRQRCGPDRKRSDRVCGNRPRARSAHDSWESGRL